MSTRSTAASWACPARLEAKIAHARKFPGADRIALVPADRARLAHEDLESDTCSQESLVGLEANHSALDALAPLLDRTALAATGHADKRAFGSTDPNAPNPHAVRENRPVEADVGPRAHVAGWRRGRRPNPYGALSLDGVAGGILHAQPHCLLAGARER